MIFHRYQIVLIFYISLSTNVVEGAYKIKGLFKQKNHLVFTRWF